MSCDEIVKFARLPPGHRLQLPDSRRLEPEHLVGEIRLVSQSPVVTALLDAVDAILLVLNAQRQIVAVNDRGAKAAAISGVLGLRPGEALACVNACGPAGCGAAPACEGCGALGAIVACQRSGRPVEAECLMRSALEVETPLEFNVRASPVLIDGRSFTVVSLRDISSEKRRQALEQIFFHDVLNTVAGLRGWALRLRRPDADHERAGERIELLSRQLEREIRDHRTLLLAESGTLVPSQVRVRAADLLRELDLVFSSHAAAQGRRLEIETVSPDLELFTDPSLLVRVLANMARNALEATSSGGTVRIWCERLALEPPSREEPHIDVVRFNVRNEGIIPAEVRERIFQRSFSTKAERGRGLGTYSMKLLGERYLSGEVSFVSTAESGTIFRIRLPLGPVPAFGAGPN